MTFPRVIHHTYSFAAFLCLAGVLQGCQKRASCGVGTALVDGVCVVQPTPQMNASTAVDGANAGAAGQSVPGKSIRMTTPAAASGNEGAGGSESDPAGAQPPQAEMSMSSYALHGTV